MLVSPPLASLPRLVQGLRTFCFVVLGQTIGDQDMLCSWLDIVFKHGVFVCSPEQVLNCCRWLLYEILKKWHAQANASLEDL